MVTVALHGDLASIWERVGLPELETTQYDNELMDNAELH